jgi:hypothetical protein
MEVLGNLAETYSSIGPYTTLQKKKKKAQCYQPLNTPVTTSVVRSSPGHPWIAAWQSGASPPHSGCCSSAWEQDESPTAT